MCSAFRSNEIYKGDGGGANNHRERSAKALWGFMSILSKYETMCLRSVNSQLGWGSLWGMWMRWWWTGAIYASINRTTNFHIVFRPTHFGRCPEKGTTVEERRKDFGYIFPLLISSAVLLQVDFVFYILHWCCKMFQCFLSLNWMF